jgi:hypothetical protein
MIKARSPVRAVFCRLPILAALAVPVAVAAAEPTPQCPAPKTPAGELAPWTAPVTVVSANASDELPDAQLRVGQAAELVLHPIGAVTLPVKAGRDGGNGGLAAVKVAKAGTYRIALATPAWIDLVAGGKALESTKHGHGEPCTGIRKIVEFQLKPGRYTVVISGNLDMRTQILVARKP